MDYTPGFLAVSGRGELRRSPLRTIVGICFGIESGVYSWIANARVAVFLSHGRRRGTRKVISEYVRAFSSKEKQKSSLAVL